MYNYVSIPQINAIIIFIGVVDHYRLMVCSHALCLLTLTYATTRAHLLENVVAWFLYNAHITVQGYILPCIYTAIINSTHSGKLQDSMHLLENSVVLRLKLKRERKIELGIYC